jgi:hypothetical protein
VVVVPAARHRVPEEEAVSRGSIVTLAVVTAMVVVVAVVVVLQVVTSPEPCPVGITGLPQEYAPDYAQGCRDAAQSIALESPPPREIVFEWRPDLAARHGGSSTGFDAAAGVWFTYAGSGGAVARHEAAHVVLFASGLKGPDHHEVMSAHGLCYGGCGEH